MANKFVADRSLILFCKCIRRNMIIKLFSPRLVDKKYSIIASVRIFVLPLKKTQGSTSDTVVVFSSLLLTSTADIQACISFFVNHFTFELFSMMFYDCLPHMTAPITDMLMFMVKYDLSKNNSSICK